MMKPRYFVPIHGEYRMLHQHRLLAEAVGIERERVFIMRNGEVLDIAGQRAERSRRIAAGNILVDGFGFGDVGNIVLRDRKHLAEDGILVIIVTLSRQENALLSARTSLRADLYTRGNRKDCSAKRAG